jgi:tRNA (adenine37-N6)-methyltransferase
VKVVKDLKPSMNAKPTEPFHLVPIGHIEKRPGRTVLRLEARYQEGLLGLEQWSHIWVFYWFDQNDTPEKRAVLQVHPRGNRNNPLTGVFATRSPMRPNLTALSLCRVVSIQGSDIEIEGIDAFDQTPVIDLKPYIQETRYSARTDQRTRLDGDPGAVTAIPRGAGGSSPLPSRRAACIRRRAQPAWNLSRRSDPN